MESVKNSLKIGGLQLSYLFTIYKKIKCLSFRVHCLYLAAFMVVLSILCTSLARAESTESSAVQKEESPQNLKKPFKQQKLSDVPFATTMTIGLDQLLGVWHDIAHKPAEFANTCRQNIELVFTYNENGQVEVEKYCRGEKGLTQITKGEAFIINPPYNTQLKISFLPETVRWLPFARDDYWILKMDQNNQVMLVGEPKRKHLLILSRTSKIPDQQLQEFLRYAQSIGYSTQDVVKTSIRSD
ncbi:MAG: lipocalin family protein [Acinetobacter sp.]